IALLMASTAGAYAADVTYERLRNPEPQNWLMNHRDFASQRYSPLNQINKTNAKNLKLAFAVPLGGKAGNEYVEATPLVDNGFMYITDVWGVVYKIDVHPGRQGQVLWKMDPGQQKPDRNRGVALWGNLVISVTGYYDPQTNITYWGTANPVPRYDSAHRPGDNLFTNSSVAFDAATGKMQWFFQHTANDNRDYDSSGPQIIIDGKVNNEDRKLLVH